MEKKFKKKKPRTEDRTSKKKKKTRTEDRTSEEKKEPNSQPKKKSQSGQKLQLILLRVPHVCLITKICYFQFP